MTADLTTFAGLTALPPGESLSDNGYAFQFGDRFIIDRLLRLGAVSHAHDAHAALADPTDAPTLGSDTSGGALPAGQVIYVCYTWTDENGGETAPTDFVTITTARSLLDPTFAPAAAADYSAGTLLAGAASYAVTVTDGLGGETVLGPPVLVDIEPGHPNAQVLLSGLSAVVANSNPDALATAGWRLWRQIGGGPWYLIGTGAAASDTFDDNGVAGDCTVQPPFSSTVGGTNTLKVTVPAPPAGIAPSAFTVYASYDGSFASPALLGIGDPLQFGTELTFTDLTVSDGSPPPVSQSFPGAHVLNPDIELAFGVKSPVATAANLPTTGNAEGDIRGTQDVHELWTWLGGAWHRVLGPWLLPVATEADLPVAPADGSVCVTLDTGEIWEYNATAVQWQARGGVSMDGTGPSYTQWLATRDDNPPASMVNYADAGGGATMAVANGFLTTSDETQTEPLWGRPSGPSSQLMFQDATNNNAWTNGSSGRPPHDTVVASWAAAGEDLDSSALHAPHPVYTDPTFGSNQIGDTLDINSLNADHNGRLCVSFWWDGTAWQPRYIDNATGDGYSPTAAFVGGGYFPNGPVPGYHAPQLLRAAPGKPYVYAYKWTEASPVGLNEKMRVHFKDAYAGITNAAKGENLLTMKIGLSLFMTDENDGLTYYLGDPADTCVGNFNNNYGDPANYDATGWTHSPMDLLLCAGHFPSATLQDPYVASDDITAGIYSKSNGPVTYSVSPTYDVTRDGVLDGPLYSFNDFWADIWTDGAFAYFQLYMKDPDGGAQPVYTSKYDLTGTPYAGTPVGDFGVVANFLTQNAGFARLQRIDASLADDIEVQSAGTLDIVGALLTESGTTVTVQVGGVVPSSAPGGDHTLTLADLGTVIELDGHTLTIPANASLHAPLDAAFEVMQLAATAVTVAGDSGVTLDGTPTTSGQYTKLRVRQRAYDEWVIEAGGGGGGGGGTGPAGPAGARGSDWYDYTGAGAPAAGTFGGEADGDYAVRESDGEVFKRVAGAWVDQGFSLKGPTGPTGAAGSGGGSSFPSSWRDPVANTTALTAPRLQTVGHSYSSGSGLPSPATQRATALLAGYLGTTDNDFGVGGACLTAQGQAQGGWAAVADDYTQAPAAPYRKRYGQGVIWYGINDVGRMSTGSWSANAQAVYKQALRFAVTRMRAGKVFAADDASVVGSAGFAVNATGGDLGGHNLQTSTNGSTVTISVPEDFPGGDVALWVFGQTGFSAQWTSTVDGAPGPSIDTSVATGIQSNSANSVFPFCARVTNLAPGAHTIVMTVASIVGGNAWFYGWAIAGKDTPTISVIGQFKLNATGYANYATGPYEPTDADVDALNAVMQQVVAEFTDGTVNFVDLSSLDHTAHVQADGLHPDVTGHQLIAGLMRPEVPLYLGPEDGEARVSLDNHTIYVWNKATGTWGQLGAQGPQGPAGPAGGGGGSDLIYSEDFTAEGSMAAAWQFDDAAAPFTETATGLQANTASVITATLSGLELGNAVATAKFLTGGGAPSFGLIMRRSGPDTASGDFFYFSYVETGSLELRYRSGGAYTTISTDSFGSSGGSGGPANNTAYWYRAYMVGATLGMEIWDIDPDTDAALSHKPLWSLVTTDNARAKPMFGEWGFIFVPLAANGTERVQSIKFQRITVLR